MSAQKKRGFAKVPDKRKSRRSRLHAAMIESMARGSSNLDPQLADYVRNRPTAPLDWESLYNDAVDAWFWLPLVLEERIYELSDEELKAAIDAEEAKREQRDSSPTTADPFGEANLRLALLSLELAYRERAGSRFFLNGSVVGIENGIEPAILQARLVQGLRDDALDYELQRVCYGLQMSDDMPIDPGRIVWQLLLELEKDARAGNR